MDCYCKSQISFDQCCEPILQGTSQATTAEALMRARYSAYALKNMSFIEKSHDPKTVKKTDMAANREWAESTQWKTLDILSVEAGTTTDDWGRVEFKAEFETKGKAGVHHEISEFHRRGGTWYFSEGKSPQSRQIINTQPLPGRNDPCHCGSGKKFKKCCA